MRKLMLGLAVAGVMMLVAASPASAARAVVFKNGDVGCQTDPGDVPGFGVIALPTATLVIRADDSALLSCHGWLPGGARLGHTFHGTVPCNAVAGVFGRIVVSRSGRVSAACHFPRGTF
jgi:hypothetical protein